MEKKDLQKVIDTAKFDSAYWAGRMIDMPDSDMAWDIANEIAQEINDWRSSFETHKLLAESYREELTRLGTIVINPQPSEQKPPEANLIRETDDKCKEILTKWLNAGFDLDIALPQAMQEYALHSKQQARIEAIHECLLALGAQELLSERIITEFETLKNK